jgi:hypothetical protein
VGVLLALEVVAALEGVLVVVGTFFSETFLGASTIADFLTKSSFNRSNGFRVATDTKIHKIELVQNVKMGMD